MSFEKVMNTSIFEKFHIKLCEKFLAINQKSLNSHEVKFILDSFCLNALWERIGKQKLRDFWFRSQLKKLLKTTRIQKEMQPNNFNRFKQFLKINYC